MDRYRGPNLNYRTLWISDIHLGTKDCKAKELLEFIKHTSCEKLYLVGDIVDGWQLKRKWFWPQSHNDVVQKILRKARQGTKVIFIPGNHDEFARHFMGFNFGDIEIKEEDIHVTANGKRMWVTHGDVVDPVMHYARWLAYIGDQAYTFALFLNRVTNRIRQRFNLPYWSLSQYLKDKVKSAVSVITAFEELLTHEAKRKSCDGVICGHIHRAEIREIDGIQYANDGDWVESMTALAEEHDGQLKILHWPEIQNFMSTKSTGDQIATQTLTETAKA